MDVCSADEEETGNLQAARTLTTNLVQPRSIVAGVKAVSDDRRLSDHTLKIV